jgi:hypothetical protein
VSGYDITYYTFPDFQDFGRLHLPTKDLLPSKLLRFCRP